MREIRLVDAVMFLANGFGAEATLMLCKSILTYWAVCTWWLFSMRVYL